MYFQKKTKQGLQTFHFKESKKSRADLCFLLQIKSVLFSMEEMPEDFLC